MKRILVVEDLVGWRDNLMRSLKKIPACKIEGAENLEQAKAAVGSGFVDLALVDWNLTDVDGNHDGDVFIQYLEQVEPKTRVIVISGTIPSTDAHLGPNVCDFVSKSDLNFRQLRQKVQLLLYGESDAQEVDE